MRTVRVEAGEWKLDGLGGLLHTTADAGGLMRADIDAESTASRRPDL